MSLLVAGALCFVGIDWAATSHAVCVLDAAGHRRAAFTIDHTAAGFAALIGRLGRLGPREQVAVAIERPDGRLVDALLEAGYLVVPVSPNAIKTWRESENTAGAKSDPGDAYVIADYLRCRARRWRRRYRTARTPRPCAKTIFADITSPIALAFCTRYPTAAHAATLTERRLATFCAKQSYSGHRPAAELLARLRTVPAGTTDPVLCPAIAAAVAAMVNLITTLNTAIHGLERTVTATLSEHPDSVFFSRCRINHTPYDPTRHGNAVRLTQTHQPDVLAA